MEKLIIKTQTCISASTQSAAATLAFHKNSQTIPKAKPPKVRIIHIFAPEIIKTDVANFRELVQRLTGKPTHDQGCRRKNKARGMKRSSEELTGERPSKKIMELSRAGLLGLETREQRPVIKEEEGEEVMWIDNNGGHDQNFLNGFGDFDRLIQELGHDQFPFLPNLDASADLHGFE